MDKWEVCYVDCFRHELVRFTPEGLVEKKLKKDKAKDGDSKNQATARVVAWLGLEGWELTNGEWDIGPVLFFRRRVQS
jgi:hypothetical protein